MKTTKFFQIVCKVMLIKPLSLEWINFKQKLNKFFNGEYIYSYVEVEKYLK